MKKLWLFFVLLPFAAQAQLERKPADSEPQNTELTFETPRLVTLHTVEPLPKHELHFAIMHNFGEVRNGLRNLYGLDNGANVRFSLEYGLGERFSVFLGRSSLDKVVDTGFRTHLLKQKSDNSIPLSVSLSGTLGITTNEYRFIASSEYSFPERLSYAASLMLARKFGERVSLQLSPMVAHFNRVGPELNIAGQDNTYFSVGGSGRFKVTKRTSVTAQYVPAFTENLRANVALGVDIETGGHVFQVFFSNAQALNDQYLLAGPSGDISEGEFRIGFNVNRVFYLGPKKQRKTE
ncbi:MAG: DUF5777 family beta-barrel protein [Bernardetiaceae bacterium]